MTKQSCRSSAIEARCAAVEQIKERAADVDRLSQFPQENVEVLGKEGLLGLIVPAENGGMGADMVTFVDVVESVGASCASTGMVFVMHNCGVRVIDRHMKEPRRKEILTATAAGKHLSTLACSERGTGSHFTNSFSRSRKDKDGYRLNADKCFVTSGGHANSYVLHTRAVENEDTVVTTYYLVDADLPGITFSGKWEGMGLRGNSSIAMSLKDCLVPESSMLGEQGTGSQLGMGTILPVFLTGTASVYQGIARAALEAAVAHAQNRKFDHTGDALLAVPHIRRTIAEMKVSIDASRALLDRAARALDDGQPDAVVLLLEARQRACQGAVDVTRQAMQIGGGIAYAGGAPIERHMRDALAGNVMAPTSDVMLELIGRATLGLPLV